MATFLNSEHIDYKLLAIVFTLIAIGLVSIFSATYDAGMSEIFLKQVTWVGLGIVVMVVVALLPFRMLQRVAYPAYFLSILALISVLLLGHTVSGSTSWFSIGTFRLQPSEFAKVATVLALANFISRTDVSLQNLKHLFAVALMLLLPVVLILRQPDTGTALIYLGMFFPLLYWGAVAKFTMIALVSPIVTVIAALFGTTAFLVAVIVLGIGLYLTKEHRVLAAVVFSLIVLVGISVQSIYSGLKPYQQKRIETFLDPNADPLGAGYNLLQSKVAIGSGGFLGKGFLRGTQTQLNFIPEQWTDFIFCVPGEEFGFLGATVVLLMFLLLLLRCIQNGAGMKNPFGSFVAIGIAATFGTHIVVSIGMSLGLLPVVGVPLPFLSYGGSALITNMIMIGLLLNLYAHRKVY